MPTFNQLITGSKSNIQTSGVKLFDTDYLCYDGVTVKFQGEGWVGASGVTPSNGYPLSSGNSLHLPVKHTMDIYVIAPGSGLTVKWLVI